MENLKKKLSMAKKPETGNGDAVRELNLYKQNNAALQKQIDSLMKKLNQSEEEGRNQKRTLEETQKACDEWQEKANRAEELKKSSMALQNTIDHLEYRLELANVDKVDAEEQLLNIRSHRTPFDPKSPKVQVPENRQSTRTSMSTVFANDSPISQSDQEPTTLAAFISHIERLQEQARVKDMQIAELDADNNQLREEYNRLRSEHRKLDLQSDIQDQLLKRARQNEIHIEELRTAIIKRESMIGEKSKALQQTERQLSHHRLLLEAEIRRHANLTLLADAEGNPLPELTSLASKEDIDRWVDRLQKQLNKDKTEKIGRKAGNESTIDALRRENEFYVREIIYYKLDCRGYKSDIKKLKKIAAQMGGHDSRPGDVESPDPSVSKSVENPAQTQLLSIPSNSGVPTSPSPVSIGPISLTIPMTQRMTPPPSELTPAPSPTDKIKRTVKRVPLPLDFNMPLTPRTPPMKAANLANEADNNDPGISPRSVALLSPERRKPTVWDTALP
jgi:DNA repair exonuclease SbcCD ATPase subunit